MLTDLERRALLGDRQAQEECTERGIILPCPLCGGQADKVVYDSAGLYVCKRCKIYKPFTIVVDGARKALAVWNTRPAPPVGRCGDCAAYVDSKCANTGYYKSETGFCDDFAPKEGE